MMRGHHLDTRIGGHPRYAYCHEWELMQIPPEILKCVCYVEVREGSEWRLNGTAFLVGLPLTGVSRAVEGEPMAVYAVTAKHVLHHGGQTLDEDDPWWYDDARLVLNSRSGGVEYLPVRPELWAPHPASDTAVVRIDIPPAIDFMLWPAESYVNTEFFAKHELTPGEEVIVTGLLWAHPGEPQITPIVRVGHVASFPIDRVNLDTGPEGAVLIEVLSFGGLSGSPAFLHLGDFRRENHGRGDLLTLDGPTGPTGGNWLLGIVQGGFEEHPTNPESARRNVGITSVIPAARIDELLHSEQLAEERQEIVDRKNESAPKTRRASVSVGKDEPTEFGRFEDLTGDLLKVPKKELDDKLREDKG